MDVRRLVFVSPAQLNMRSAAALAGSGVFRRTNNSFSAGQAATMEVSVDGVFRYCVRSSVGAAVDAVLARRVKKAASSLTVSSAGTPIKSHNDSSRGQ